MGDSLLAFFTIDKALEIFNANKAKGFWGENPTDRDLNEVSALILSELFEGFEALRKRKFADQRYVAEFHQCAFYNEDLTVRNSVVAVRGIFDTKGFEEFIKDRFEDEIADTVIRCMDLVGYLSWEMGARENEPIVGVWGGPTNFEYSHELLYLGFQAHLYCFDRELIEDWAESNREFAVNVINFCIAVSEKYGFRDTLLQHIELKLMYNTTRPFKHGKAF